MTKRTKGCSSDSCDRKHHGHGWCMMHLKRWKRHGDPEYVSFVKAKTPGESLALRTEWQGDCLIWTGTKFKNGYGHISTNGKPQLVHRFVWEREHGEIPEGKIIDHTCHNRACVNICHLRLATHTQNTSNRSSARKDNKSGIRNVYLQYDKWQVKVTKNSTPYYFGAYDDLDEAAEVAQAAREKLFGEFAGRG